MSNAVKHLILVVDDQPSIRQTVSILLKEAGYDVCTAEDGFAALLQLKRIRPHVIVSDLNMPKMSGFEFLSVVRRRFPDIPVVAVSGAFDSGDLVPGGVIADAFYPKGSHPEALLRMIAELIRTATLRAVNHQHQTAPVWIPVSRADPHEAAFIVLTCTHCLRSFPMDVLREDMQGIQETPCLFCTNPVRYVIDFSIAINYLKARAASTSGS